jgi:hypothetical protein
MSTMDLNYQAVVFAQQELRDKSERDRLADSLKRQRKHQDQG